MLPEVAQGGIGAKKALPSGNSRRLSPREYGQTHEHASTFARLVGAPSLMLRRTLEGDIAVVGERPFSGVVGVGHDADGARHGRLLAESALVILVDIAH